MNKYGVLAFCGSKGSGKSMSATLFKELFDGATEELAIAGHLKEVCAKVFNVDYEAFIDPARKEVELEEYIVLDIPNLMAVMSGFLIDAVDKDKYIRPHVGRIIRTPRALLQYIGTEVLHPIDPLIHVKVTMKKKNSEKLTIITDLRFMAEFQYFEDNHAKQFLPVYVKNTSAEVRASTDSHASEREFEKFKLKCLPVNNEGSLPDLKSRLSTLVKEIYE